MTPFLKSKVGLASVVVFTIVMALVCYRVATKRKARASAPAVAAARATPPAKTAPAPGAAEAVGTSTPVATPRSAAVIPSPNRRQLAEDAAYLDRYFALDGRVRADRDPQGNQVTRRPTLSRQRDTAPPPEPEEPVAAAPPPVSRPTLRLQGRTPATAATPTGVAAEVNVPPPAIPVSAASSQPAARPAFSGPAKAARTRPERFNPYGRLIKCELVFTIDSTNEQTPLVAVVMEPVYNNGSLVIPAGAEFHGTVRPDRLRNRIFSGPDWVLVFPREPNRINGRQLNVHGVALDRVEPDANGMTWGITDGSYGLEGMVIRTLQQEDIKRFVATFFASGSLALQDRQTDRAGQQAARNTPQNAALQGLAANFQRIVDDISREIEEHGVFIRVPAGHQFYFYPMQVIDPDAADISSDIATVK